MRINRLGGEDQFDRMLREGRHVQQAAPAGRTSVHDGRTRFVGNESLLVQGSQKVSGWLVVTGTLKVVGTFLLDGVTTITGLFKLQGPAEITGDVAVKSPGKITVEGSTPIVLRQASGAAVIDIGSAQLFGFTGGIGMAAGAGTFYVIPTEAGWVVGASALKTTNAGTSVVGSLATTIDLTAGRDVWATGKLITPSAPTATGAANVFINSTGAVQKVGSASRFKIDPQPMILPDALLDVPVQDWVDRGNAERFAALYDAPRPFTRDQQADFDGVDLTRVPGVIAEEVAAAGGEAFVTRDESGTIEGVAYDRLALARTEILARKQWAADQNAVTQQEQINSLQIQVNELIRLLAA